MKKIIFSVSILIVSFTIMSFKTNKTENLGIITDEETGISYTVNADEIIYNEEEHDYSENPIQVISSNNAHSVKASGTVTFVYICPGSGYKCNLRIKTNFTEGDSRDKSKGKDQPNVKIQEWVVH